MTNSKMFHKKRLSKMYLDSLFLNNYLHKCLNLLLPSQPLDINLFRFVKMVGNR